MALAHAVSSFAAAKGDVRIGLLHVNFALRGAESDADQGLIERFAGDYGIDLRVLDVRAEPSSAVRRTGEGIQEWARRVRRQWFFEIAKQENAIIALAHHQNDVAENVILRMVRGSGIGQLAGMSEFDYPYWRPFLDMPKDKISAFVGRQHIPHHNDSSNDKLDYNRNKLRLRVIPELEKLYPGAIGRIAAMAVEANEMTSFVRASLSGQTSEGSLAGEELRRLPRGVAIELISGLAKESCEETVQLSRTQLYSAWEHIKRSGNEPMHQWSCELQPGKYLRLKDDTVTAGKSTGAPCQTRFRQHIDSIIGWDCRFQIGAGATIEIEKPVGSIRCFNPGHRSRSLAILSARSHDTLSFRSQNGTSKKWRFGVLMKLWEAQSGSHPIVWVDDEMVGLLDGDFVVTVAADGQKRVISRLEELLTHVP